MSSLSRSLRYYENFPERVAKSDREKGREDGARGEPEASAQDYTGHQQSIIQRTRSDLSSYVADVDQQISRTQEKLSALQARSDSYAGRRTALLDEQKAAEERYTLTNGTQSPRYKIVESNLREIEDQFKSIKESEKFRPIQAYLSKFWYLFLFVILFLIEIPINASAIETVFSKSILISYILAGSISGALMYFSHGIGRLLRQPSIFSKSRAISWGFVTSLFALSLAIILSIYFLRDEYANSLIVGQVGDSVKSGWFFLVANSVIFATGLVLSLFHHDPNPDYQRLHYQLMDMRKKFSEIDIAQAEGMRGLFEDYDEQFRRLGLDAERLDQEIEQVQSACRALRDSKISWVELVLDVLGQRLSAYQEGNRTSRNGIATPPIFGSDAIARLKANLRKDYLGKQP